MICECSRSCPILEVINNLILMFKEFCARDQSGGSEFEQNDIFVIIHPGDTMDATHFVYDINYEITKLYMRRHVSGGVLCNEYCIRLDHEENHSHFIMPFTVETDFLFIR